jgi:cell migration-inducing and hyaluronan-binding protein
MSSGAFGREAFTSLVVDSLFVGETENIGNPVTPEEKAYGRSLPKRAIPDFPIRGYEYYDYRVDVANTTFVNYQDNARRQAGALSWLMFTSSGVTTENTIKGAKFVNAKPVHFPNIDTRFDNDNRGAGAWQSLAIHDLDGSVTGMGDSYVLLYDGENNSVATDGTCTIHPTWNASLCKGDIGRLNIGGAGGAGGGLGRRGGGAPRAGGAGPGAPGVGTPPGLGGARPGGAGAVAGAAAPRGGGAFGGGGGTPQPPVVLTRDGEEIRLRGNGATVKAGTEVKVKTERPEFSLSLSEMELGSWVVFELPGFANAADAKKQDSLDALRKASENSYFKDQDSLWVKVVVATPPAVPAMPLQQQASVRISR